MPHLQNGAPTVPPTVPHAAPETGRVGAPDVRCPPPPKPKAGGHRTGAPSDSQNSGGAPNALPGLDGPEVEQLRSETISIRSQPALSDGQRLTRRKAAMVAAGVHPLRGGPLHPQASRAAATTDARGLPFTCGTCIHRDPSYYPKCVADKTFQTSSATTDCRAWWPACSIYEPREK